MSATCQEIHLWPELLPPSAGTGRRDVVSQSKPLPLPFAPAKLVGSGERPQLLCPNESGDGVIVEPFLNPRKQLKLLATFPNGADAQLNGEPAPRRVVLDAGDVVQWAAGIVFHVTVFNRPLVGPPPTDLIGKDCPICRVPFAPDATTCTCPCGCVFHCEADEKGLQCAQLRGECPRCKRPVVLQPGYAFTPGNE